MAIIYSYPKNTNLLATDILVGTSTVIFNGKPKNQTKSFSLGTLTDFLIQAIGTSFVPYTGAVESVDLGEYSLTANSIIKDGGTSSQYLMADGSVSLGPTLTGFVPYTGATQSVNLGTYNLTANKIIATNFDCSNDIYVSIATGERIRVGVGGGGNGSSVAFGYEALDSNTSGAANVAIGYASMHSNTIGNYNTGVGHQALFSNTEGENNVALGADSMAGNVTGTFNTAIGTSALLQNTTASNNTAVGGEALYNNTTGNNNAALGYLALNSNTTGANNIAVGNRALQNASTNSSNIAIGNNALQLNTGGNGQIAIGLNALSLNTTGNFNTAIGLSACTAGTTGSYNTAVGYSAMYSVTVGNDNTALGRNALYSVQAGNANTGIGQQAMANLGNTGASGVDSNTGIGWQVMYNVNTGFQNTAVGRQAGRTLTSGSLGLYLGFFTTASSASAINEIVIGANATGAGSNTVVIGNTSITTTRLRGAVQGGSFVKDGGTAIESLMANGSVTTNGTLYKATSITYQTTSGSIVYYSSAIPSSIFTNGDNLKIDTDTTTTTTAVAPIVTQYYINSSPSLSGATQIGQYSGGAGFIFYPMDRVYWVNGGQFYGRNFTGSNGTNDVVGAGPIGNVTIPATQFYIIVQVITTSTDLACLSNFQITKS